MGDIVGSEEATVPKDIHDLFNKAVEAGNRSAAPVLASPLTITLGDEFQGLGYALCPMVSLMRRIRLDLLSVEIDCRFAIGMTVLRSPLNTRNAWNMMGSGLARTRERLNEKQPDRLYRFVLEDEMPTELLLEALALALTSVERRWTSAQRQVIAQLLEGDSPADVARHRGVSVHSIYKIRNAGDYDLYVNYWDAVEKTLGFLDRKHGLSE